MDWIEAEDAVPAEQSQKVSDESTEAVDALKDAQKEGVKGEDTLETTGQ